LQSSFWASRFQKQHEHHFLLCDSLRTYSKSHYARGARARCSKVACGRTGDVEIARRQRIGTGGGQGRGTGGVGPLDGWSGVAIRAAGHHLAGHVFRPGRRRDRHRCRTDCANEAK